MAGINLGTAFLQIVPSFQGIEGETSRGLEQESGAAGGKSGKAFAIAAGAAVAASAAIVAGLKKAYDVGSVFDDVADTIRVGTGKSGAALQELSGIAKTVATTIPTSFEAASTTITQVSQRLGLSGDSLKTVSSQFLEAGRILGEDVDIKGATASFAAFGIKGADVSKQMDVLFRVAQSTGVGINDLTAGVTAQAPALQTLGFSFSDTASIIGTLNKAGLDSGAITASMGKGLVALAKKGEEPAAAYKRVTEQITALTEQGKKADALKLASSIFGTKGANQFVAAIESGALSMDTLNAATKNTGDTILGVAAETNDAAEAWTLLKNKGMAALEPIGSAVFGLAGTGMSKLADSVGPVADKFAKFSAGALDKLPGLFSAIGDVVGPVFAQLKDTLLPVFEQVGGILGPAIVEVFNTLKPAISQLLPVFMQLLPVFNPVSLLFKALLPVLPQIAELVANLAKMLGEFLAQALTALTPLFDAVVGVIGELIPFISQLVASLLPPLMSLFDSLAPLLKAILDALMPLVTAIADALIPVIQALMPIVKTVFEFLATSIGNAINVFKGLIEFFTGVFTGDWGKAWDGIKRIFGAIWDQIKNILSTVVDIIVKVITDLGPKVLDIIQSFFGFMVEKGKAFLSWLLDGIKAMAENVFEWFTSLPGWLWDRILAAVGFITEKGKVFLSWLWDGIKAKGEEVFDWFASLPGWAWDRIKEAAAWFALRGEEFIGWIGEGIRNGAEGIWTFFKELPGKAWDALIAIKDDILDIGKNFVEWIVGGIASVAGNIWKAITDALTGVGVTVNGDGTITNQDSITGLPITIGGGARGAIVPGKDPGRRDNVLASLPNGKLFGLRSEEAIMVPEFTRWAEGHVGVEGINRVAEAGQLDQMFSAPTEGFALGGVAERTARKVGIDGAWDAANKVIKMIKGGQVAGGFAGNGQWGPGTTNGFAANTAAAKTYIEGHFPGVASIGGLYGGSVPGSDHPMGKALDVMIANYLSSAGIANGTRIADWFINNPNSFGTKYVIWRDRINEGGQWAPYQHPSGSDDTLQHRDHVHISFLTGGGEFAGGATNPVGDVGNGIAGLAQSVASKLGIFGGSTSPGGSGVDQWVPLMSKVIREKLGSDQTYFGKILNVMSNQMAHESSGDPNAVNRTDSNAQAGHPSVGLLQFIPSTFAEWADRGFNSNIMDPESQMRAFMNYVPGTYGGTPGGYDYLTSIGYRAYDRGGLWPTGTPGINLTGGTEAVLTPPEAKAYQAHAAALEAGYSGRMPDLHFNLSNVGRQYQLAVRDAITDAFDRAEFELDVVGAQS